MAATFDQYDKSRCVSKVFHVFIYSRDDVHCVTSIRVMSFGIYCDCMIRGTVRSQGVT